MGHSREQERGGGGGGGGGTTPHGQKGFTGWPPV
jgi:hypothetical protein